MNLQDLFFNQDGTEYSTANSNQKMKPCNLLLAMMQWQAGTRKRFLAVDMFTEDGLEYKIVKKADILGKWYVLKHVPTRRNQIFNSFSELLNIVNAIQPEKVRFSSWEHIAPWTPMVESPGKDIPRFFVNNANECEEIEDLQEYHAAQDLHMAAEYYSGLTAEYGEQLNA